MEESIAFYDSGAGMEVSSAYLRAALWLRQQ